MEHRPLKRAVHNVTQLEQTQADGKDMGICEHVQEGIEAAKFLEDAL
jgi:hypothetical protein